MDLTEHIRQSSLIEGVKGEQAVAESLEAWGDHECYSFVVRSEIYLTTDSKNRPGHRYRGSGAGPEL